LVEAVKAIPAVA